MSPEAHKEHPRETYDLIRRHIEEFDLRLTALESLMKQVMAERGLDLVPATQPDGPAAEDS